ncbi:MAG: extradiol dioxygenase [Gemmatimonadota bacterium]
MISGAHVIIESTDADADRAFIGNVLGFPSVDAGRGWLIFALPPAELAFHPGESNDRHSLYLMTDDVHAMIRELTAKEVVCGPVSEERWGIVTSVPLPGGGKLGLYQPRHPVATSLSRTPISPR